MILVPCERVNHPSRSAPPSINLFCGAMATPRIDSLVALFFFFSSRLLFRRSPHFFCVEVERFALFGCDCNQALFVRLTRKLIKWHGDGRGGFFFLSPETWLARWESAHGRLGTVGTCDPCRGPDRERRPGFSGKINLEKKKPP